MFPTESSVIDLLHSLISCRETLWSTGDGRDDLRRKISSLIAELDHFEHNLGSSKCSIRRHERYGIYQRSQALSKDLGLVIGKVQRMQHRVFPSSVEESILELENKINEAIKAFQNLRNRIEQNRKQSKVRGQDYLVIKKNNTPKNSAEVVLDFASKKANGKRRTLEGELLDGVLLDGMVSLDESRTVIVIGRGLGGTGKTCAMCGIAYHPEVLQRFWGSILYTEMGRDTTIETLIESIINMVKRTGGGRKAVGLEAMNGLDGIVRAAGEWFKLYPCLFLFDDIRCAGCITPETITILRGIARHPCSRVVLTTRDAVLTGDVNVDFGHRDVMGQESRKILLAVTGFKTEPESSGTAESFERLLRLGSGLPLKLALIGSGVLGMSELCGASNREKAWVMYDEEMKEKGVGVKDFLLRSLSLIERKRDDNANHHYLKTLSLFDCAQSVKIDVVCETWGLSQEESLKEVKLLSRYQLLRLIEDSTKGVDEKKMFTVSVQEEVSSIAREEAGKKGFVGCDVQRLMESCANAQTGMCGVVQQDSRFTCQLTCRLLMTAKRFQELLWLISEPRWLVHQLRTFGAGQVLSDLEIALQCAHELPESSHSKEMNRCIRLLKSTVEASNSDVLSSSWIGMPWFQLHGRLSLFAEDSPWVREYVGKIEKCAPKPWYRPSVGCLLPACTSLRKYKIFCYQIFWGGKKVQSLAGNVLYYFGKNRFDNLVLNRFDFVAETNLASIVLHKAASDVECAALSNDAGTTVVCQRSGDILVCRYDPEMQPNTLAKISKWTNTKLVKRIKNVIRRGHRSEQGENECLDRPPKYEHVGNYSGITCVALRQDGKRVVSGAKDGSIQVWGLEDGAWKSRVLRGHKSSVENVAVNEDGRRVVSGSWGCPTLVWNLEEDEWRSAVLECHTNGVYDLAMNGEGTCIVSGSSDHTIRVWCLKEGEWRCTVLEGHSKWIKCLAVNEEGTRIVSASHDETLRVWDLVEGEWKCAVFEDHSLYVTGVSMNKDSTRILFKGLSEVLELTSETRGWNITLPLGQTAEVPSFEINEDGMCIVFRSWNKNLRVWNLRDGEWKCKTLGGHRKITKDVAMNKEGTCIVSGSFDGTIEVWKLRDDEWKCNTLEEHTSGIRNVFMNEEGTCIVSQSWDRTVQVWNFEDDEWKCATLGAHGKIYVILVMNEEGTCFMSGSLYGTTQVWKLRDDEWKCTTLKGCSGSVKAVVMNEKGTCISGSLDGTIRVWKLRDDEWNCNTLEGHTSKIQAVTMNEEGTCIVSESWDKNLRVWNFREGEWKCTALNGYHFYLQAGFMNKEGTCVVSGSWDKRMRALNLEDGKWKFATQKGLRKSVRIAIINKEGTCILSWFCDGTIEVWKLRDDEWKCTMLRGYSGVVKAVAMNKEGTCIVSGSLEGIIRVWKLRDDEWKFNTLEEHTSGIRAVIMNEEGTCIVSQFWDRTVQVWNFEDDEWKCAALKGYENMVRRVNVEKSGMYIVSKGSGTDSLMAHQVEWRTEDAIIKEYESMTRHRRRNQSICGMSYWKEFIDSDIYNVFRPCQIYRAQNAFFVILDRPPYLVRIEVQTQSPE